MTLAISPCPNDTFAFYSLIQEGHYNVNFLDIEELNRALIAGRYPIAKGSFAIIDKIAERYEILPTGAAIGKGVGPVFVGTLKNGARVALPGENTTAHRLFHFWKKFNPELQITPVQMPFFEMLPSLESGQVDAAVLIHEGRFIYPAQGLDLICDLGAFWEEKTGAMIPLGCIYAEKSLPTEVKSAFVASLQDSITKSQTAYSQKSTLYKEEILPYMRTMAQEKDDHVVEAHVDTYVTEDTFELRSAAHKSIEVFREAIRP